MDGCGEKEMRMGTSKNRKVTKKGRERMGDRKRVVHCSERKKRKRGCELVS